MNMRAYNALQQALGSTPVRPDYMQLVGGLDETTPPYQRATGTAREMVNFDVDIHGGYRRIAGYERFDGQTKPSEALYWILNITLTAAIAVGDTVTGATSAATGKVLAVVTSGTPNYLVLGRVSGTFQSGETLNVGGNPKATTSSASTAMSGSTAALRAAYKNLAADDRRADIAAVPGSGKILGVFDYNDVCYAIRNNAGGTAAAVYKSSSSGWVNVPLGEEISFTAGNSSVGVGDTLTQGGVTATIKRVIELSGTSPNIVGKLIIYGRSGGNFAAGAATSSGAGALTLSAVQSAVTLLPDGRYKTVTENFGGASGTKRVYGCDGVNRGFEFDGTDYGWVPIDTGMSTDTPSQVGVNQMQLFFAFGSSAQHSAPGTPFVWSPVLGASELAMGDDITGFKKQPGSTTGGAFAIFTRNRLSILYGTGVSDWQLVPYRDEVGAYDNSLQDVGVLTFLDDRGVTNIKTSQSFGNFSHATISDQIRARLASLRTTLTASCISRDRSQYRLFFSSGYAIHFTLAGSKLVGIGLILYTDVARCVYSGEMLDGSEVMYFGSVGGMVYQMDRGTSFDGDAIAYNWALSYNFLKSPRVNKKFHDATLEITGNTYAAFSFGYSLGYGAPEVPQPATQSAESNFSAVYWDSFTWDAFYWDGVTLGPTVLDIDGEAENISLAVSGNSDEQESFTITAAMLHYTPRARLRP